MRIAGFFLLVTGWLIAVSAVLLLHTGSARGVFSAAALLVEATGFGLLARSHILSPGERFD